MQLRQQREQPEARAAPAAASSVLERVSQEMEAEREHRKAGALRGASMCMYGSSKCRLSRMSGKTLVSFGSKKAACLNGDRYAFFVTPGASDKLVFYFQGGGACFSPQTFALRTCTQGIDDAIASSGTSGGQGIFDTADRRNGLRDHTIVEVLYCSGDLFVGNTVQNYNGTTPQVGYRNARAVLAWVLRNTPKKLSSLVLAGGSAGALGVQAWAHFLLKKFRYDRATVLVDSYVGVFPRGTASQTLQVFGSCDLPIWLPAERSRCRRGRLSARMFTETRISKFPGVPFGFLQSKADSTQRSFFNLVSQTFRSVDPQISGPAFYHRTNGVFASYTRHPNFVAFYVDGETHTFTGKEHYYTTVPQGIWQGNASGTDPGQLRMHQFVNRLVKGGRCPSGQCAGELSANNRDSTDFCDEGLFPKTCAIPC